MLTRCNLSMMLIAIVLTFVTLLCCARTEDADWVISTLPDLESPGPDSVIVDTTGVAHIYNSSSNWHCWGNPNQGWQVENLTDHGVICLDMATEEDETHAAYVCLDGHVYYQWRKPHSDWQVEKVESFQPESVERVEIERAPNGTLWLAVLHNDIFYLYAHTPDGWVDYVVETMPAQFNDQSLWRFEVDWDNQLQLVRQISPIGFYHITGTPGDWSYAIINNIEDFPGDTREFELVGMEMRKDNTPILHVEGYSQYHGSIDAFTGVIFNNEGDWEAATVWISSLGGLTAYDHARDRIHRCHRHWGNEDGDIAIGYDSVALGPNSRDAYTPVGYLLWNNPLAMTIGKLDLPHIVGKERENYIYFRPRADIYVRIDTQSHQDGSQVYYGYEVANWKWERTARVGFVMEIAGSTFWWPKWSSTPQLPTIQCGTGLLINSLLLAPMPDGQYGIDVTFYTALLNPTDNVLLNGASWDMLTVTY